MSDYRTAYFETELDELIAFVEKDHSKLYNRDLEDQHPIEAISGLKDALDNKVDKEEGKGLSSNDFTDEYKQDLIESKEKIDEVEYRLDNLKPEDIGAITESAIGETVAPVGDDGYIPSEYIPPTAYDFIVGYPVDGQEELSKYWLSQTPDGDPLIPEKGKLYCLGKNSTTYSVNSLFRWATTAYISISAGSADVEPIPNDVIDSIILGE